MVKLYSKIKNKYFKKSNIRNIKKRKTRKNFKKNKIKGGSLNTTGEDDAVVFKKQWNDLANYLLGNPRLLNNNVNVANEHENNPLAYRTAVNNPFTIRQIKEYLPKKHREHMNSDEVYTIYGHGASCGISKSDMYRPVPKDIILITLAHYGKSTYTNSRRKNLFHYMYNIGHYMLRDPLKYWSTLTSKELFGNSLHLHFTEYNGLKNTGTGDYNTTYIDQSFTCMLNFIKSIYGGGITSIGKPSPKLTFETDLDLDGPSKEIIMNLFKNDLFINKTDIEEFYSNEYSKILWESLPDYKEMILKRDEYIDMQNNRSLNIKNLKKEITANLQWEGTSREVETNLSKEKFNILISDYTIFQKFIKEFSEIIKKLLDSRTINQLDSFFSRKIKEKINDKNTSDYISLKSLLEYKQKGIFYYMTCRPIDETDQHLKVRRQQSNMYESPNHRLGEPRALLCNYEFHVIKSKDDIYFKIITAIKKKSNIDEVKEILKLPIKLNVLLDIKYHDFEERTVFNKLWKNNSGDKIIKSLLHYACLHSNLNICILLIEKGIDIDITDSECSTPLISACKILHEYNFLYGLSNQWWDKPDDSIIKIIKYLLDNGSNINHQNNLGNTPLIELCKITVRTGYKHTSKNIKYIIKIFDLLLERNASIFVKNNDSHTAYDILDQYEFKTLRPELNILFPKLNTKPSLFKRMKNGVSNFFAEEGGTNEEYAALNENFGGVFPL